MRYQLRSSRLEEEAEADQRRWIDSANHDDDEDRRGDTEGVDEVRRTQLRRARSFCDGVKLERRFERQGRS